MHPCISCCHPDNLIFKFFIKVVNALRHKIITIFMVIVNIPPKLDVIKKHRNTTTQKQKNLSIE
jgi:hypothetical protein